MQLHDPSLKLALPDVHNAWVGYVEIVSTGLHRCAPGNDLADSLPLTHLLLVSCHLYRLLSLFQSKNLCTQVQEAAGLWQGSCGKLQAVYV